MTITNTAKIDHSRKSLSSAGDPHSLQVASMYKIGFHQKRVKAYLKGEKIFPVTLELDLTSRCNRTCPDCPSTRASQKHNLNLNFIDTLFSSLEGETKGLLLTGGEPTLSPIFPKTLKLAREKGFIEIAVVTNGSFLHKTEVENSLLQHASTIRLSLYDWEKSTCHTFESVLKKIESLRRKIDQTGSKLQIGISALTAEKRSEKLQILVDTVRSAGAHWIYFHPLCTKWNIGRPTPQSQVGIMEKISEIQAKSALNNRIFFSSDRYENFPLKFANYHSAHFLLVVGADGLNYLGPEVKYHPRFVIADLAESGIHHCLWRQSRTELINAVRSQSYSAIQSRHRSVLYSHFIENLQKGFTSVSDELEKASSINFQFPYIL